MCATFSGVSPDTARGVETCSHVRTSDVPLGAVHRVALRPVYGAGPRWRLHKKSHLHHISASLSVVLRVGCLVRCARACLSTS